MFIVVLFTIARIWKYPSIVGLRSDVCIHTDTDTDTHTYMCVYTHIH